MIVAMEKKPVKISLAAEILGVSPQTIRRWEKLGKLKSLRSENGYRLYDISQLESFARANSLKRNIRRLAPDV